ncbi:hypothetical protein EV122DRAFT_174987, partial [Schizophyllum commune]
QEERLLLDALIKENGADKVKEYISRTFTPTVIKIRRITPENAHEWIDLSAFAAWLVDDCQQRLRGSTPPRSPAPPDVEQQRPPDVQQPRPTEVQQPRNPEVHQPRPSSTPSPPFPPPSTNRPLQKRVRLLDLEDIAAHPDSDDPLATGPSDARNVCCNSTIVGGRQTDAIRQRKRRHTCFFDEEGSAQASGSNRIVGLSPFTGHSGSSQDTDRPFDVV